MRVDRLKAGHSKWVLANNNPVNYTDPEGLRPGGRTGPVRSGPGVGRNLPGIAGPRPGYTRVIINRQPMDVPLPPPGTARTGTPSMYPSGPALPARPTIGTPNPRSNPRNGRSGYDDSTPRKPQDDECDKGKKCEEAVKRWIGRDMMKGVDVSTPMSLDWRQTVLEACKSGLISPESIDGM